MVEVGLAEVVVLVAVAAAVAAAAVAALLLGCHWEVQTDRLLDHDYRVLPSLDPQKLKKCHLLHRRVHLMAVAA